MTNDNFNTQFPSVISFRITRKEKLALKEISRKNRSSLSEYFRTIAQKHIILNINQKAI